VKYGSLLAGPRPDARAAGPGVEVDLRFGGSEARGEAFNADLPLGRFVPEG
jgi:hypothetical protein